MKNKTVLPSITCVSDPSGWMEKIRRISEIGIEEVALFPTILNADQRKDLYAALEKSTIKKIPHVHLRSDMENWELDLFMSKYQTHAFNIHPNKSKHPFVGDFSKYASKIFIENLLMVPEEEELRKYSGLCIDFSHWEGNVLSGNGEYNRKMLEMIEKFPIGCCHVSAVRKHLKPDPEFPTRFTYDQHIMENLSDLDYLKKYKRYLPEFISIELENSIDEQLEAKKYLEKIINS